MDIQTVAIEYRQRARANVGRQHVQRRTGGQFVEAAITVQVFLVVLLKDRVGSMISPVKKSQLRQQSQRKLHRETSNDMVPQVKLHELDNLTGSRGEARVVAIVTVPIQDQVCRQNGTSLMRIPVAEYPPWGSLAMVTATT